MSTTPIPSYDPPRASSADIVYSTLKGIMASIPYAGGLAAELIPYLVIPPLQKRQEAWMNEIAQGLRSLESDGRVSIDALRDDPRFITTLLQATQAAVRNHQQEKLAALRNAVLNSGLPGSPDDSIQLMYVRFIDTFNEWHIRILHFYDDPIAWYKAQGRERPNYTQGGIVHVVEHAFPELAKTSDLFPVIWRELVGFGLVQGNLDITISESGLTARHTTDFGRRFLKFIADPIT